MTDRYLGRLIPGIDICDINGDKVGTLAQVYRHSDVTVGAGAGGQPVAARPTDLPEMMEIKTGFMGLGPRLYVPLDAIQDTLNDCIFLSQSKEEFDQLGWRERPPYLDQLQ